MKTYGSGKLAALWSDWCEGHAVRRRCGRPYPQRYIKRQTARFIRRDRRRDIRERTHPASNCP